MTSRNALILAGAVVAVMAGGLWLGDVVHDRQYRVAVVSVAAVYELLPTSYPVRNPVVVRVSPGETLRVLRVRYGKDFEAIQVELQDGQTGWVIGGDGVSVVARG